MLHTAFKQATRLALRNSRHRWASTTTPAFVRAKRASAQKGNFGKTWLSDPATYPIIAVMGGALALLLGVSGSCLLYNPDVQINANKRGSILRE
ncbi:unnamed protein product [Pseudo-nitzschia multistriata]|uniref:Uncharacterized protein n=1 Tax=Pseudo-nitzschia multistriata TaxID=183589 RepID=A0A448ZA24_9STRA|nr:unnamed protein product [Pseudo-nitzschia multistriata]